MRTFILRARKSVTKPFDLDDLSAAGRMEIVCACISNALWVSNNVRQDTIIHVVLEGPPIPPVTITFSGNDIKNLTVDERGIADLINNALRKAAKMDGITKVSPGITVQKKSFEALVKDAVKTSTVYYLHPKGKDVLEIEFKNDVTFVFGDYIGMPDKSESFLDNVGAEKATVGPVTLFASQCITLAHNALDRI